MVIRPVVQHACSAAARAAFAKQVAAIPARPAMPTQPCVFWLTVWTVVASSATAKHLGDGEAGTTVSRRLTSVMERAGAIKPVAGTSANGRLV